MTTIRFIRFIGVNLYPAIVGAVCIISRFLKQENTWFEVWKCLKKSPHNTVYVCRLAINSPREFAGAFVDNVIWAPITIGVIILVKGRFEYDRMQEAKVRKSD